MSDELEDAINTPRFLIENLGARSTVKDIILVMKIFFTLLILSVSSLQHADVYDDLAKATGGSVNRQTKEEFLKAIDSGDNHYELAKNATSLLIQDIDLSATENKEIKIPIDEKVFGVLIAEVLNSTQKEGKLLVLDTQNVAIEKDQLKAILVKKPVPGTMKIKLLGPLRGTLQVRLQSLLDFRTLRFVELGGRPGHQGYFALRGNPKKGAGKLELALHEFHSKEFISVTLIDLNGNVLESERVFQLTTDQSKLLNLDVPSKPFRVLVKGANFQRIYPTIFTPVD